MSTMADGVTADETDQRDYEDVEEREAEPGELGAENEAEAEAEAEAEGEAEGEAEAEAEGEAEAEAEAETGAEVRQGFTYSIDNLKDRLQDTISSGYLQIDLARCKLPAVPDEVLTISSLRHVYLANNYIEQLPDTILQQLPNLEWLDVRNNNLRTLVNMAAGFMSHNRLRNLLVSNNKLKILPPELGLTRSLTGLSIADNPIEYPPEEVLNSGTVAILRYLKQTFSDSIMHRQPSYSRDPTGITDDETEPFPTNNDHQSARRSPVRRQSPTRSPSPRRQSRAMEMLATLTAANIAENLEDSANSPMQFSKSAVLHAHLTNQGQIRQIYIDKLKSGSTAMLGAKGTQKKKKKGKNDMKVQLYPEPPGLKKAQLRLRDEQERQQERDTNEKIMVELQRMKHADFVERWRTDAKMLQRDANFSQRIKSELEIQSEAESRARQAPFHVDHSSLRMQTNEDRSQLRNENIKREKPRALSPEALEKYEKKKQSEEQDLEERVYRHSEAMRDRRKKSASKNGKERSTVDEARMELEVALRLKREIENRRRELEMAMHQ